MVGPPWSRPPAEGRKKGSRANEGGGLRTEAGRVVGNLWSRWPPGEEETVVGPQRSVAQKRGESLAPCRLNLGPGTAQQRPRRSFLMVEPKYWDNPPADVLALRPPCSVPWIPCTACTVRTLQLYSSSPELGIPAGAPPGPATAQAGLHDEAATIRALAAYVLSGVV